MNFKIFKYLVECGTKHPLDLIIDALDIFHSCALTNHFLYLLHTLLDLNLHSLGHRKLRLFQALDLLPFGLGLSTDLLCELLLRLFFILFLRVRHRVVHIVDH